MISILFFFIAGYNRGVAELLAFKYSKSTFSGTVKPVSFFGSHSWLLKYKPDKSVLAFGEYRPLPPLKNWYYRLFDIEYRERFLFSTTALVWMTDGFHLFNMLMKVALICAILSYDPFIAWYWMTALYIAGWSAGHVIPYNILFQKKSLK